MENLKRPVKEVDRLFPWLPGWTESDHNEVLNKGVPALAVHDSKGVYHCLKCGHSWKAPKSQKVVCPHCQAKLKMELTRKRCFYDRFYVTKITTLNDFQVILNYYVNVKAKCDEKPEIKVREVFQRWMRPGNADTIVSLQRNPMSYYVDSWMWSSEMKVRNENDQHFVAPYFVVGKIKILPQLQRNGFKGGLHGFSPRFVFSNLLNNNHFETLWKVGRFDILDHLTKSKFDLEKYWPAIKIVLRHNYKISDVSLWLDMISNLQSLDKDVSNPKLVCPENLREAHDKWHEAYRRKEEKARRARERQLEIQRAQRELEQLKQSGIDDENYKKRMGCFFGLILTDKEINIVPLKSVEEFKIEGDYQHHCVFTNKYYKKEDTLIFHALVENKSIATIEFNINSMRIVQCRGKHNNVPEHKDRIEKLIMSNIGKIAKCKEVTSEVAA